MTTFTLRPLATAAFACLLLAGCHVNTHRDGNKENVDIGTPFGSMKVDTDKSGDTSAIGIAAYPGATPVESDNDNHGNNANVNLSFGGFHLGVKAASFQTSDSSDKVLAFYRKDLAARYGDVIECQDHTPVGSPSSTSQGLTCSNSDSNVDNGDHKPGVHLHGTLNGKNIDAGSELQLRAGSQTHQHIVSAEPRNGGTKIGLVALDLPSHLGNNSGKQPE